eukprot:3673706-Amphidinium_carterae.1
MLVPQTAVDEIVDMHVPQTIFSTGVLSVIAQQLLVLFGTKADIKSYNDTATLAFEEMFITMTPTFNVSIIMSPGHASRPELLDNLGALLRSFAMM